MRDKKRIGITRKEFIRSSVGTVLATSMTGTEWAKGSGNAPSGSATVVRETKAGKFVSKDVWVVEKSAALRSLTIDEGASLAAPAGKSLTMTIDGIGTAIRPGSYVGNIFLTVSDELILPASGLMRKGKPRPYRTAIFIKDGKYIEGKSVPAIVRGGKVTDSAATGVSIFGCEDDFNGIIILGDSTYTIDGLNIDFEGMGHNDWIGLGAGLYCGDNAKVTVNNSTLKLHSITRCALHACGHSVTTFNNCRLSNVSAATDWMNPGNGFKGSNRTTQECDYATTYYNNCHIISNGWGALSHDGGLHCRMYLKDSTIEVTGPRAHGYGAFSIGDCFVSYDHCTVNVQGYPLLIGATEGKCDGEIVGGTVINSSRFGVKVMRSVGSELKVDNATFNTASSAFVAIEANAYVNISNVILNPANGVVLQLADGRGAAGEDGKFHVPEPKADTVIKDRDLTKTKPKIDFFMTVSNTDVTGDFYNSTTNLNAKRTTPPVKIGADGLPIVRGVPKESLTYAAPDEPVLPDLPPLEERQGPRNLDLKFANTRVKGVISAATAVYQDGITVIDDYVNGWDSDSIIQTAHEPVNNGVIVSFDKDSVWTVTGLSYLTSLDIANGAVVKVPAGRTLTMTVDGVEKKIVPGIYKGKIVMKVS
jgi:hypothetical protein